MRTAESRLTTLAVRDEDRERAVMAIEAIITRIARNSGGGWACLPYEDIQPLAQKILRHLAEMKLGCVIQSEATP
jgi:hypothetical protein